VQSYSGHGSPANPRRVSSSSHDGASPRAAPPRATDLRGRGREGPPPSASTGIFPEAHAVGAGERDRGTTARVREERSRRNTNTSSVMDPLSRVPKETGADDPWNTRFCLPSASNDKNPKST
jgi:hypothetical protein